MNMSSLINLKSPRWSEIEKSGVSMYGVSWDPDQALLCIRTAYSVHYVASLIKLLICRELRDGEMRYSWSVVSGSFVSAITRRLKRAVKTARIVFQMVGLRLSWVPC